MTPKLIGQHAYDGSFVRVRHRGHTRDGVIDHCSGDGEKLYVRFFRKGGFQLSDNAVPVPYDRVLEIRHGALSTAPEHLKRQFSRGVR
ncbi:MAG: hypothetical protein ACX939_03025 [Hyphococcus sp.]